jgi:hypothetical protein
MSALGQRLWPHAKAGAALAILVLATFAPVLPASRVLFERDIHAYWHPHRAALRAAVAEAGVPLWNPWIGFGAPFLADASSAQMAYPPTWLLLPLPLPLQFELLAIAHSLLAALGAAALARRLIGGGALPALVAGACYALAGPLLSAVSLYHHFAGAAFMPWVLWALEGLLQRRDRRSALVLGAWSAGQLLAGSGDLVLMTALLALARAALELRGTRGREWVGLLRPLALAAALSLSIGAVQWLPTLERGVHGLRATQDFRTRTYWSLHPSSLVDLGVARLVSEAPLSVAERGRIFEGREPLLACLYLGVLTLLLAMLGLVLRQPRAAPLAVGFALFLVLSLGRHTPIYALLLALPGFGLLRYPQKYLLAASLLVALLAAAGASAFVREWTEADRRRARALGLGSLALAAIAALASLPGTTSDPLGALKLGRSALLLALGCWLLFRRSLVDRARLGVTTAFLLLGGIDLVLVGRATNPVAPAALYEHRPAVLDRLEGASGRLLAASESSACLAPGAGPAGWDRAWVAALGFLDTLRPPGAIRWGLFGSYDGEFTGLGPRWSAPFTGAVHAGLGTPAGLRLLQIGGVEHVLLLGHSAPAGLEHLETFQTPYACPLLLLRVPDRLPGAYVVGREVPQPGDALTSVVDSAFDPRLEVLVAGGSAATGTRSFTPARIVSRTADTVQVEANLSAPGVLVLTEAFDDGWRVEVDGRPAEVLRANGLFRAVRLGAGRHEVRFQYRPWSARAGIGLSGLGLVAALATLATLRPRARKLSPGE